MGKEVKEEPGVARAGKGSEWGWGCAPLRIETEGRNVLALLFGGGGGCDASSAASGRGAKSLRETGTQMLSRDRGAGMPPPAQMR